MSINSKTCCSNNNCCTPNVKRKQITIDFLYLDLTICERCQGTESNLDEAINTISAILTSAGYDLVVNKINISSRELANKYEFISSPTIRVNGRDIAIALKESECENCGELCGESVDCRVWYYDGKEYTQAPKELIINCILKEVYAGVSCIQKSEAYVMPENLVKYFDALDKR
jgi:hypothetical protein